MKKIFALIAIIAALTVTGCAKDFLETDPTDQTSISTMLSDANSALTALNGMYRAMYYGGWGSDWEPENGGLPAYTLMFDVYAEDHVMDEQGSGWFYYDYAYWTWEDYTYTAGHQYQVWNFFYTLIANANNIIGAESTMSGDEDMKEYVMGQAYAIRANAYWWLANAFCFNGYGEDFIIQRAQKGVPIYTEPTAPGSEGKGRGTVQDVYDQINADIDKAIEYLESTEVTQQHISHINKTVAYGLKARFAMTQNDYATALEYAEKAMGTASIADFTAGASAINDSGAKNVLWALAVQADQVRYTIFEHMDADCNSTYSAARHLIGNWLYDQIPAGDGRLNWWTAPLPEEEWGTPGTTEGSRRSWCQKKIVFTNAVAQTGDHILMREEELYLAAAESACRLEQYTKARNYIQQLGEKRVADYKTRLDGFIDSNKYGNIGTTYDPITLLDEILLQRRIELWSEFPRIFDIQRQHVSFTRMWPDSNHVVDLDGIDTSIDSPNFILHIPDSEFDANHNMSREEDQNPDNI